MRERLQRVFFGPGRGEALFDPRARILMTIPCSFCDGAGELPHPAGYRTMVPCLGCKTIGWVESSIDVEVFVERLVELLGED